MNEPHNKIKNLEQRIKLLEEENNSLSERIEEMLLLSLINESFESITDEKVLLTSVLEKISILKNIPYCACYQISENKYNCLVQYCSLFNQELCSGTLELSEELLHELKSESIIRYDFKDRPNAARFQKEMQVFEPKELLALTFSTRNLSNGVFIFVSNGNTLSPFSNDLQPFHQLIQIVTDKWDRLSLLNELQDLNRELEERVKERTSRLQQSEEKYRQLFNIANDAIFLWEVNRDEKVIGCIQMSEAAIEMTGYIHEDLKHQDPFLLLDTKYSEREKSVFEEKFRQPSAIFRATFNTPNGLLPLEVHTRRFNVAGQELVLAIARDISKQVAYQQKILEAKNKAVESEKLKSAFLANMSHEIRTPMNAIVGFSELLCQDELTPNNEIKLYADIIFKNSLHLLNLINDIVEYSKIEADQVTISQQAININDLISELSINMISILHKTSKSHIDVLTHTPFISNEAVVVTDGTRLRQILSNLINNAIKFTNKGFIEIGYSHVQNNIEFFVRDTGIGIAPADQKKVFERFVQVRHEDNVGLGGTGLGLAICSNLVDKMHGHINLESTVGEGSTFWFSIPYVKANAE